MVARIVEVERQCAQELEKAEADSRKAVEEHRKSLEDEKNREFERIAADADGRLQKAVDEANRAMEEELESTRNRQRHFLNDPDVTGEIEERILSILLAD
jgi:DNA anti-recombination protein RmuC